MRHPQYWTAVLLVAGTGVLLASRGDTDRVPPSQPLDQMPEQIGPWTGTDIPLEGYVLDVLGKGVFLNRNYTVASASSQSAQAAETATDATPAGPGPIGLFIGYFPTQRTGQAIHSPQNCLPGAGWTFTSSRVIEITGRDGKTHQVGDYLISNGRQQNEVLYWYQSRGRSIASDYKAKAYTLIDSIRYHRTDAALVRIVAPVVPGESPAAADGRATRFAADLFPLLPPFLPN